MATWNITVPAQTAMGGAGGSGSQTHDVSGSRPSDFDGATINSVTLSGLGNVTLNTGSSNDDIGVRWCIENSTGVDTYGNVSSDAGSVAYAPLTVFSNLPVAQAAGGSPSPAPTTAVANNWHQVNCTWTYGVSGKNDESTADSPSFTIVVDYTPAGQKSVSGTPNVTGPTASGSLALRRKVTGAVTTAALDVTGSLLVGPRVYLNSTETLSGATEMTVTAWNKAGTSITFTDPVGAPTGSLKLGVENRGAGGGDSNTVWTNVTVNVAGAKSITGTANVTGPTASGSLKTSKFLTGSPTLAEPTVSANIVYGPRVWVHASAQQLSGAVQMTVTDWNTAGTSITYDDPPGAPIGNVYVGVENVNAGGGDANTGWIQVTVTGKELTGAVTLSEHEVSGSLVKGGAKIITGAVTLNEHTVAGSLTLTHPLTGAVTLEEHQVAGSLVHELPLTGAVTVEEQTVSGSLERTKLLTGAVTLAEHEVTGSLVAEKVLSGNVSTDPLEVSATLSLTHPITGAVTLAEHEVTGSIASFGVRLITGNVTLDGLEVSGSISAATGKELTGGVTLDEPTVTASLVHTLPITGAITMPELVVSGSLSAGKILTGAITLSDVEASGSIAKGKALTGTVFTAEIDSSGALTLTHPIAGTPTLDEPTVTGSLIHTLPLTGTVSLDEPIVAGSLGKGLSLTGGITLDEVTASGSLSLDTKFKELTGNVTMDEPVVDSILLVQGAAQQGWRNVWTEV